MPSGSSTSPASAADVLRMHAQSKGGGLRPVPNPGSRRKRFWHRVPSGTWSICSKNMARVILFGGILTGGWPPLGTTSLMADSRVRISSPPINTRHTYVRDDLQFDRDNVETPLRRYWSGNASIMSLSSCVAMVLPSRLKRDFLGVASVGPCRERRGPRYNQAEFVRRRSKGTAAGHLSSGYRN